MDNYENSETLGKRLRILRTASMKSVQQIANGLSANGFNFSRRLIDDWENDERIPNANALVALSKYYKVSSDYLLGIAEDKFNYDVIRSIAEDLNISPHSADILGTLSILDGGMVSALLSDIIEHPEFINALKALKKSKDGISRQIHYLDKEVPNNFKEQCVDMADMYIVNAHKAFDVLLKDALGYNTLMERISDNGRNETEAD